MTRAIVNSPLYSPLCFKCQRFNRYYGRNKQTFHILFPNFAKYINYLGAL